MAPPAGPPVKPDGRRFLQVARRQLSRAKFDSLLVVMKEVDDGDRTREQAVAEADRLFGPRQRRLLQEFAALLGVEPDVCDADDSSDSSASSDEQDTCVSDKHCPNSLPSKQSLPGPTVETPDILASDGARFFEAARERLPADLFSLLFESMSRLSAGQLASEDTLKEVRAILIPEYDDLYQGLHALLHGSEIGGPDGLHAGAGTDSAIRGFESRALLLQKPAADGRLFFREAHNRLPQGLFDMLLASLKGLNDGTQTHKETLDEARKIFGEERSDLYVGLEALLSDGGLRLDGAEGADSSGGLGGAAASAAPSMFGGVNTRMMEGVQFASARRQAMETIKKLNDGLLSREQALQEARKVFGPDRTDLYNEFAALLGNDGAAEAITSVAEGKLERAASPLSSASGPVSTVAAEGHEPVAASATAAANDKGRRFFQKARVALSREALGDFLRSQKQMNDGELTREGMLEEVKRIFGPELSGLFDEFASTCADRIAEDDCDPMPRE